jgi:hypothetical protein
MGIPPSLAAGFPTAGNYYSTENRQCKESNGVEFLFIRRKQKAAWSKMKKISKSRMRSEDGFKHNFWGKRRVFILIPEYLKCEVGMS